MHQQQLEEEILRLLMQDSKEIEQAKIEERRKEIEKQDKAFEESLKTDENRKQHLLLPVSRTDKAALFAKAAEERWLRERLKSQVKTMQVSSGNINKKT